MKSYELIQRLSELPAGYEVEFGRTVLKEEIKDGCSFVGGEVENIEVSNDSKRITLLE